jgi:hypothetical protein
MGSAVACEAVTKYFGSVRAIVREARLVTIEPMRDFEAKGDLT